MLPMLDFRRSLGSKLVPFRNSGWLSSPRAAFVVRNCLTIQSKPAYKNLTIKKVLGYDLGISPVETKIYHRFLFEITGKKIYEGQ